MINTTFKISFLSLLFAVSVSCQKNTDFSYIKNPPPPTLKVDKTYQFAKVRDGVVAPEVDIVWVIDNSGSMGDFQRNVQINLDRFMVSFSQNANLLWKMGLLSTDESELPYLGFGSNVFDKNTANPVQTFNAAISRLGISGTGYEEVYGPLIASFQDYKNFLRPNAYLALIVVSDAPDQSTLTTNQFLDQLKFLKNGQIDKILTYFVMSAKDMGLRCYNSESHYFKGSKLEDLMLRTSGVYYDMCDSDFAKTLTDLGKNLVGKIPVLSTRITLDEKPFVDTIVVTYKGQILKPGMASSGGQWVYDPIYNYITIVDPAVIDGNIQDVQVSFTIDNTPK